LNASPLTWKLIRSLILNILASATFSLKFQGVRSLGLFRVAFPNTVSIVACGIPIPRLNWFLSYQRSLLGSNLLPDIGARQFS
jgi:hypothetical protein